MTVVSLRWPVAVFCLRPSDGRRCPAVLAFIHGRASLFTIYDARQGEEDSRPSGNTGPSFRVTPCGEVCSGTHDAVADDELV